jgi:anti-sigma-K factor RskA
MKEKELRDIRREIRAWARRSPALSPRVARTRIVARLEERRSFSGWRVATISVSVVALLALGLLFLAPEQSSGPVRTALSEQSEQGLLVYELQSGSKLYLVLAPQPTTFP